MTARQEWIRIQRRLVEELKDSLYDTAGRHDPVLDRYYREYQQEFSNGYDRVASRDEIVQRIMRASVAYFGDFHSLKSAQDGILGLLEAAAERGRRIIFCVEMLHTKHQEHTDDYLRGEIDDEQLLWRVQWDENWGFSWPSWKRFLSFAIRRKEPLFGLNMHSDAHNALYLRDDYAARLVATLTRLYPRHLIAVVYGDLHMAQEHLPAAVNRELAEAGVKRRSVTVYQNSETLYWTLVNEQREAVVDYLKLRNDVYVLMNATPLVKFQSFEMWQHNRTANLNYQPDEINLYHEQNLFDRVHDYVDTIADFLGVELEEPAGFTVHTSVDLGLLDYLTATGRYSRDDTKALKSYAEMADSAYFERARVLYIGRSTVADVAEAAGRYILAQFRPAANEAVAERDEFYARCLVEALAFFCSKVIDPRRAPYSEREWKLVLTHYGRRRKLERIQRLDLNTAKAFLRHKEFEHRVLKSNSRTGAPRSLYSLEIDRHVALTRALGRDLGQRMYAGVSREVITRDLIREVMQDPVHERDVAVKRYFELLELLKDLEDTHPRREVNIKDEE
jgi:hypothetical protein